MSNLTLIPNDNQCREQTSELSMLYNGTVASFKIFSAATRSVTRRARLTSSELATTIQSAILLTRNKLTLIYFRNQTMDVYIKLNLTAATSEDISDRMNEREKYSTQAK